MYTCFKITSQCMCKLRKFRLNFFFYFQKIKNFEITCKKNWYYMWKKQITCCIHVEYMCLSAVFDVIRCNNYVFFFSRVLLLFLGKKKFVIITITISPVLKITITIRLLLLLLKFTRLETSMMNAGVCLHVRYHIWGLRNIRA